MTITLGGVGNTRMDTESELGTADDASVYLRYDDITVNDTQSRKMIANHIMGHRNPYTQEKPMGIEMARENALTITDRIRRPAVNGGTPTAATLWKSAGMTVETTSAATTTAGSPAVGAIDLTADVSDEGQALLIAESAGLYVPVLVANYDATPTVTPLVDMASAPSASAVVQVMHTFSFATATTYQVPTDQTLQFQLNTLGKLTTNLGDLSILYTGCAVSSIDAIEIGSVGSYPSLKYGIHAAGLSYETDAIAAESFADSDKFAMITDDFRFSFTAAAAGGGHTLNAEHFEKATITPGIKTVPIYATGEGTVNGILGYMLVPTPPTVKVVSYFEGSATLENEIISQMEGSNVSKCLRFVQPTTDLDTPAFGFWLPNCHLSAADSFSITPLGQQIKFEASFTASTTGLDSLTDIDEVESSPMYFAISSEAAA